jgi:hypothetical protein
MAQNVGQSRGSQKHKQFVQDSANSYIVDAFKDMAETAPVSPVDGEGYIVENVGSIDPTWGTITGLANGDIIRWRQSKLAWQIVMAAAVDNQGFKAFVKDEDTLYVLDAGAEWIVASGSGGGVKNFAQKQATAYKPADWIQGNSGIFGASGTLAGLLDRETVAPLDGKKSFKYTTAAGSGDDWFYLLVDIDQYARGGVVAFTFDYQWDGDEDISVEIWDPTFTNEYSTELNLIKNTTNDNKLSRNSRTIYAQPDTESQVVVGFQIASTESTGKTFIWDNLKVTDDIGVIGSGAQGIEVTTMLTNATGTHTSSGSVQKINFGTVQHDTVGAADLTNNRIVIQEEGYYDVSGLLSYNSGSSGVRTLFVRRNGNDICRDKTPASTSGNPMQLDCSIVGVWLDEGDIIELYFQQNNGGNLSYSFGSGVGNSHLSVSKNQITSESGRFLQVPNGEKFRDTFSAKISSAGNIDHVSSDWIDNVVKTGTGGYRIYFKPGLFSTPPAVVATVDFNATDRYAMVSGIDTNSVWIKTFQTSSGTTYFDEAFSVVVHKNEETADIVGIPVSIQGQTHEQDTALEVQNFGGYTTLNGIPNVATYTNLLVNNGSAATFINNTYFQINESGLFHLNASCAHASEVNWAIFKNSISTNQNRLASSAATTATTGKNAGSTRWLNAGDIVFVQCGNPISSSNNGFWNFTCAKVGTQPLLDGGVVKEPDTSYRITSVNGANNGYVSGTKVINFANVTENRGDGVEWDPSIASYRILRDGVYSFTCNVQFNSQTGGAWAIGLWKNKVLGNTEDFFNPPTPENKLTEEFVEYSQLHNPTIGTSWTGYLTAGEYVNVCNENTADVVSSSVSRSHFSVASVGEIKQYTSRVYKEDPIAWQRKDLTSTVTSTTADVLATGLSFNNLEAGKTYRLSGNIYWRKLASGGGVNFGIYIDGVTDKNFIAFIRADGIEISNKTGVSTTFTATTDGTLEVYISGHPAGTHYLNSGSWLILEELPFHAQTSKWT